MRSKTQSVILGAAVYVAASLILQLLAPGAGAVGMGGAAVIFAVGCLVMLALGAVPVWHYTRANDISVPAGSGAGMGALSIAIGAIVIAIVTWVLVEAGISPDPRELAIEQMEDQGLPQEQIDAAAAFAHPLISGIVGTIVGAILGAIGGAIGASIFRGGGTDRSEI